MSSAFARSATPTSTARGGAVNVRRGRGAGKTRRGGDEAITFHTTNPGRHADAL